MRTWKQLATLPEPELAALDVAEVNLACAADLPGSEKIDVGFIRDRLDYCAERVWQYTEAHMKQFHRKRHDYNNSESFFRSLVMITVLQRDLGVRYNPAKIPEDVPLEPEDSFIHGIFQGQGGTCASMPVVYLAVGRRLGYPLKLVTSWRHYFVRWDDPNGERFNIEGAGQGFSSHSDEWYRTFHREIPPEDVPRLGYLKSLSPREEMACFLHEAACHWKKLDSYRRAVNAQAWACGLAPQNEGLQNVLGKTSDEWHESLRKLEPPGFPPLYFHWGARRFPDTIPEKMERNILYLEALENLLKDPNLEREWWGPIRTGIGPRRQHPPMDVSFRPSGHCHFTPRMGRGRSPLDAVEAAIQRARGRII